MKVPAGYDEPKADGGRKLKGATEAEAGVVQRRGSAFSVCLQ